MKKLKQMHPIYVVESTMVFAEMMVLVAGHVIVYLATLVLLVNMVNSAAALLFGKLYFQPSTFFFAVDTCANAKADAEVLCSGTDHGTCTDDGSGSWSCVCETEYTGPNCEVGEL